MFRKPHDKIQAVIPGRLADSYSPDKSSANAQSPESGYSSGTSSITCSPDSFVMSLNPDLLFGEAIVAPFFSQGRLDDTPPEDDFDPELVEISALLSKSGLLEDADSRAMIAEDRRAMIAKEPISYGLSQMAGKEEINLVKKKPDEKKQGHQASSPYCRVNSSALHLAAYPMDSEIQCLSEMAGACGQAAGCRQDFLPYDMEEVSHQGLFFKFEKPPAIVHPLFQQDTQYADVPGHVGNLHLPGDMERILGGAQAFTRLSARKRKSELDEDDLCAPFKK